MLTGGAEEEEDDEDTTGMFKRVIIQVAKLPRHIQSTTTSSLDASHGTDFLWDMFPPEHNIALQSMTNYDPLQLLSSDVDHTPIEWDEFICSWGQETPSIGYPPTVRHTPPLDIFSINGWRKHIFRNGATASELDRGKGRHCLLWSVRYA
jgi:hypothetical protein